ncbi:MAG: 4-phosphoerythronate dehydrogenase [Ignavibacteriales bacterium]|nr:4-phosphoerythronate dehydrogenase [Ignavibacteriales bacterium]
MRIVANKHTPFIELAFSGAGSLTTLGTLEITHEAVRDADALIVRSETLVNKELLEGSSVRYVGTVTIGTDHVDKEYLAAHDITFASAPGSNSNSVAEYIASALLTLARRHNFSLRGKTLGVIGVGNVGSKVVRVGRALGMAVVENDPPLQRETGDSRFRSFDEVLRCDIVTVHVPMQKQGADATYHLLNTATISKMHPGAFLINSSRGAVVKGDDLLRALQSKVIAGAVLDVWEKEPAVNHDLVHAVDIATPHIAGYSLDGKVNAVKMIHESLCSYFSLDLPWEVENAMPPAEIPAMHLEDIMQSEQELLTKAVCSCYDILRDDHDMRAIIRMTPDAAAKYFMSLRSGYRIRREFRCTLLHLPERQRKSDAALRALGFGTAIS